MAFANPEAIFRDYPHLRDGNFKPTSKPNQFYNCISYAVGEYEKWWEPFGDYLACGALPVWPEGCPRAYTLEAWIAAFERIKFERCDDCTFEPGWERIALFGLRAVCEHRMRHVAWQPSDRDGNWYSKLGVDADIHHEALDDVGGGCGVVLAYMRRGAHHRADKSLLKLARPLRPDPTRKPPFV